MGVGTVPLGVVVGMVLQLGKVGCLLEGRTGCHGEGKTGTLVDQQGRVMPGEGRAGTLEDQQDRVMPGEGVGIGCWGLALTRSD